VYFAVKTSAAPLGLKIFLMIQSTVETVGYYRPPLPEASIWLCASAPLRLCDKKIGAIRVICGFPHPAGG
jgi:hypothetical protein